MTWAEDYLERANELGMIKDPDPEAQVLAVALLTGYRLRKMDRNLSWCPICSTYRHMDPECPVCQARAILARYRDETSTIGEPLPEERRPQERDEHAEPKRRRLEKLELKGYPQTVYEELLDSLQEAWELKALQMASDRAKQERRAIRRRLDE